MGVAVIPSDAEAPAFTFNVVFAIVRSGASVDLSSSTVSAWLACGAALPARSETLAVTV